MTETYHLHSVGNILAWDHLRSGELPSEGGTRGSVGSFPTDLTFHCGFIWEGESDGDSKGARKYVCWYLTADVLLILL